MATRLWPAQLVAASAVGLLGFVSRLPTASPDEVQQYAKRFSFSRQPLPKTSNTHYVDVHPVNPKVKHIARWLSSIGTSVSLGDLDGDGISNDLCAVEPRTGEVTVSPVPGTEKRFPLFILQPEMPMDPHSMVATGCKFGDFNEDGRSDLLVQYVGRTPLLFLQKAIEADSTTLRAQSFAVQSIREDEPWWTSTVFQADVDADGHLDLVVGNYFPDGQVIFGKDASGPVTMHNTFSKARNGGKNRIFLWSEASPAPTPNVVYREIDNPFPEDDAFAWTLAVGGADLNRDGKTELYFANDFGPDQLYMNQSEPGKVSLRRLHGKKGLFIPTSRVLGNDSFKGMGVDFGDINNDGYFDMFVSNITEHGGLEESHFLFVSQGSMDQMAQGIAPYVDDGEMKGVSRSSWGWDTRFGDFDNDTVLELMQATGFLKGDRRLNWWADLAELANGNDLMISNPSHWPAFPENIDISGHAPEPFYVLGKDGRYLDVGGHLGFDGQFNARGITTGDVDADGDLDLILANQWEDSWYFRNDAPNPGRSLGLYLQLSPTAIETVVEDGPRPGGQSWPAIGAVATVKLPDGRMLLRQIDGGSGHSGAPAAEALFGLGNVPAETALPVHIQWRDLKGELRTVDLELKPGWHTVILTTMA